MSNPHQDHKVDNKYHSHVLNYTHQSYRLNDLLYNGELGTDEEEQAIANMRQALSSGAKYEFDVFTGLKWDPSEMWYKHNVDADRSIEIHLPAFTSTSTKFEVACGFARTFPKPDDIKVKLDGVSPRVYNDRTDDVCHVLRLTVARGTPLASVMHISKHQKEYEVILNSGMEIKIYPAPTVKSVDGSIFLIWNGTTVM